MTRYTEDPIFKYIVYPMILKNYKKGEKSTCGKYTWKACNVQLLTAFNKKIKSMRLYINSNERDDFLNHHCLLNCWFRRRWTSKLRVTGVEVTGDKRPVTRKIVFLMTSSWGSNETSFTVLLIAGVEKTQANFFGTKMPSNVYDLFEETENVVFNEPGSFALSVKSQWHESIFFWKNANSIQW